MTPQYAPDRAATADLKLQALAYWHQVPSRAYNPRSTIIGAPGATGSLLPINQNQALFALLGITFGGNGQTNFALPNLQGRAPIQETQDRLVRGSTPASC
jgi:hypothetical protein